MRSFVAEGHAALPGLSPFVIGVDLLPSGQGRGGQGWYDSDLSADLDALSDAGFGLVRLFVSWSAVEPQVGVYDEDAFARLANVVRAAAQRSMPAIVCLFGDDRSSDLSVATWASGRDPRSDAYLVERACAVAGEIVTRLRDEEGIVAWQLGDEAFLTGFADAVALDSWWGRLAEAVREADSERPVVFGGAVETLAYTPGLDARSVSDDADGAFAHATSSYAAFAAEGLPTIGRPTWLEGFLLHQRWSSRPTLLDAVGPAGPALSVGEEAGRVRMSLWTALANGAAGAIFRRFRDPDSGNREPFALDPFESLVGLADREGRPKPALEDAADFAALVGSLDLAEYERFPERVAVVQPERRFAPLPDVCRYISPRASFAAYIAAKQAHLPVTTVPEGADVGTFGVLIVPSATLVSDDTWGTLARFVSDGGTLICSLAEAELSPISRDVLGVGYLGDGGPRSTLSCRVAQPGVVGDLRPFDAQIALDSFALLSAEAASVVATDAVGSPLLAVNRHGKGMAAVVACPIEHAIARAESGVGREQASSFMRMCLASLGAASGCGLPVTCDKPAVELAVLAGDEDDLIVLVNHAPRPTVATLSSRQPFASVTDVSTGATARVDGVSFGVSVAGNDGTAVRVTWA